MHLQVRHTHAAHTQRAELETLTKTVPEKQRTPDHRALNETDHPRDRGLMVTLWVLASLIAEVEVLWWIFARMYTT